MTPEQKAALEGYVARLQHALELDAWTIAVRDEPADPEDSVTAGITLEAKHADLRVSPGFFGEQQPEEWQAQDAENNRQSIMHELVHLHLHHLFTDLMRYIEPIMPKPVTRQLDRQYERVVDGIAHAIAPLYDPPTWPEPQQENRSMDSESKGRSDEARDPNREPGTGLGDPDEQSQNPDVNPGGSDDEPEPAPEPTEPADDTATEEPAS